MRNHLVQEITDLAATNPDIVIITGDLGYHVLDKFFDKYPDRFINAGISEQNMMSVAAGMALEGKCVFVYSIGNFPTLRCLEQIRNDVCYNNANVKIIGLGAGFAYGDLGMTHHATEDIACLRALPNMIVFSPCDPFEAMAVAKKAVSFKGPCYIRIGRGGEPLIHDDVPELEIGKAELLRDGNCGITLFSTGAITVEAIKAAAVLKEKGINLKLYGFPSIKPIDKEAIQKEAISNRIIISLEEHNIIGGFGGAISEVLSEIPDKHAVLKRFGLPDVYTSVVGDNAYLRHYYKMDSDAIVEYVLKELGK
jgi:transketolase